MPTDRPFVDFQQCKTRIGMPEVLEAFGIKDRFVQRGSVWVGACPLPSHPRCDSVNHKRNDQQFKISKKGSTWVWYCHAGDHQVGGDIIAFICEMLQCSPEHCRYWLAEHFAHVIDVEKPKAAKRASTKNAREETVESTTSQAVHEATGNMTGESRIVKPLKPLSFWMRLEPDHDYLDERGISHATREHYGIGFCKPGRKRRLFDGYVCAPIFRWPRQIADEPPVGYLGRWPGHLEPDHPRYKLPEGFPKSEVLYGLDRAMDVECERLIVVEGPFSVWHLFGAGHSNCVALLGSVLSDEQAALLATTGRRITLLLDGDDAGQVGARAAAGKLITQADVRVVKLDAGVQPDHLSKDDLNALLETP